MLYYCRDMLQMGSSRHWQDAFEAITGKREMDAGPLLEYFQPLMDWLTYENNRTAEHIGWNNNHKSECHLGCFYKQMLVNPATLRPQRFYKNSRLLACYLCDFFLKFVTKPASQFTSQYVTCCLIL